MVFCYLCFFLVDEAHRLISQDKLGLVPSVPFYATAYRKIRKSLNISHPGDKSQTKFTEAAMLTYY